MTKRETQKKINLLYKSIRAYFDDLDYLEVQTPVLSPGIIPESHISNFDTYYKDPYEKNETRMHLLPSPELYMKKLLAQGWGSIYQFSKSFRNKESNSPYHNPEFTMLEWYGTDIDYLDNIQLTEELFRQIVPQDTPRDLQAPFQRISMKECFLNTFQLDLDTEPDAAQLNEICRKWDLAEGKTWEEAFHILFLSQVEPNLPQESPLVLMDYPQRIPTLAKYTSKGPYYQRWELYIRGIEIANCYTEERDEDKLKDFFRTETMDKMKEDPITADPHFVMEYSRKAPACSGVALGFDRLAMLLCGAKNIQEVILFPFSEWIGSD